MHQKVKRAYEEAKFQIPANPADSNEEVFRRKTKRARTDDIKTIINQVWRTSQGPKKDFIFYEKKEIIPDLAGNDEGLTTLEGKYDMPKFRNVYNNQTGDVESVALAGFETEYDIPYSPKKMKEILESGDSTNTGFVLIVGTRRYGGFSAEDFVNRSFDELTQLALYGTLQPTVQNITPQTLRANDDADSKKRRMQEFNEQEAIAYENAVAKVKQLEEARKLQYEQQKKEQEEEAQKRQEAVDQQSDTRVVRAEQTVSFEKEAPTAEEEGRAQEGQDKPMSLQEQKEASGEVPKRDGGTRKASLRPEREEVGEEVGFVLTRVEDQNVNEDEEIEKGFKELEESKSKNKSNKGSK